MNNLIEKQCIKCGDKKSLSAFRIRSDNHKYDNKCKICKLQDDSNYYQENKKNLKIKNKEYYESHKSEINDQKRMYQNNKRQQDFGFRLQHSMSQAARSMMKSNGGNKAGKSFFTSVGYTKKEMQSNIESKFEYWMNWDNYGKYNPKTWDDNDSSTWKWNIDHIIPQAKLPYTSEKDVNFKKCWSLNNLRPYSAKQNLLDGATKIRHKRGT
jgi:hypothetical protein